MTMAVLKYTCDSRAVLMDRGETPYLPRLSLSPYQEGQYYARNPPQPWVQVDVRGAINSIVLKPLRYANLGQKEAQQCQLFFGNLSIVAF